MTVEKLSELCLQPQCIQSKWGEKYVKRESGDLGENGGWIDRESGRWYNHAAEKCCQNPVKKSSQLRRWNKWDEEHKGEGEKKMLLI